MLRRIYMKLLIFALLWLWAPSVFALSFDERAFGQFDQAVQQEARFQTLLQNPSPEVAMQEEIEALMLARYRERAFARDFQVEVHSHLPRAQTEKDYSINPSDLESYKKLRLLEAVAQDLSDRISYEYQRLSESAADSRLNPELRKKASVALESINQNLAGLEPEDQTVLATFLQELVEVKPAPVLETKVQLLARKSVSRKVKANIEKKAVDAVERANKILSKKLAHALKEQEENVGPATWVTPSSGPEGNVTGYRFPEGVVALTFDDGPHKVKNPDGSYRSFTLELVDILKNHHDKINDSATGAPASFFWLARAVVSFPEIAKQVSDQGYSTNCHSWNHKNLARAGESVLQTEVTRAIQAEREVYGHDFHFFRCPGGACLSTHRVREMLAKENLVHAYWSIDSLDWLLLEPDATFRNVTEQLQISKRGIVLMHDIHAQSIEAAKRILAWIKEKNDSGELSLRLYTIDQAVDLQNQMARNIESTQLENKK